MHTCVYLYVWHGPLGGTSGPDAGALEGGDEGDGVLVEYAQPHLPVRILSGLHTVLLLPRRLLYRLQPSNQSESTTTNKPGTAQVGAISKAQKDSKTTFSTTGDNKSSQKTKN